jgi:hypothetical protein
LGDEAKALQPVQRQPAFQKQFRKHDLRVMGWLNFRLGENAGWGNTGRELETGFADGKT